MSTESANDSPPTRQTEASASLLPRLSQAVFNYGLGAVLPKVAGFLLIPVYTAFLTPADYGILDLALALGAFATVWMNFGLPGAVARFYYDHPENREGGASFRDYLTSTVWALLLNSLLVTGLLLGLGPWLIERLLPGLSYFPYVVLAVLLAFLGRCTELQRRVIQAREQSAYSARLSTATALVTLVLTIFFVAGLQWGAMGHLLGATLSAGIFLFQALWYLRGDLRGRFRWELLAPSLVYAGGTFPSHLVGQMEPVLTRSILTHTDSLAAVGLLAIAVRFTQPLNLLLLAFNQAYTPVYFATRKDETAEGLERLGALGQTVWFGALFCALGAVLLAPVGIEVMTPEPYHAAAVLVPILVLAFLARVAYNLFSLEIFFRKKTKLVPVISISSAAATLLVAALTAGDFGAVGIAWAMVAGAVAAMTVAALFSRRMVRMPHDGWAITRMSTVALGLLVAHHFLPVQGLAERTAAALAVLTLFPALLWVLGDATARELAGMLRGRLGR